LQVTTQNSFDEGKEGTYVLSNDGVGDGGHSECRSQPDAGQGNGQDEFDDIHEADGKRCIHRIAPRFTDEKVEEGRLAYSDTVAPHRQSGKVATQFSISQLKPFC
jgi:hypothetical protein